MHCQRAACWGRPHNLKAPDIKQAGLSRALTQAQSQEGRTGNAAGEVGEKATQKNVCAPPAGWEKRCRPAGWELEEPVVGGWGRRRASLLAQPAVA